MKIIEMDYENDNAYFLDGDVVKVINFNYDWDKIYISCYTMLQCSIEDYKAHNKSRREYKILPVDVDSSLAAKLIEAEMTKGSSNGDKN